MSDISSTDTAVNGVARSEGFVFAGTACRLEDRQLFIVEKITPELHEAERALCRGLEQHPDLKRRYFRTDVSIGFVYEMQGLIDVGWCGGELSRAQLEQVVAYLERVNPHEWVPEPEPQREPEPALQPEPPPGPDEITFALAPHTLAKQVVGEQVIGPPHLLTYRFVVGPVESLDGLLVGLEAAAADGAFALRGRPLAPVGRRALKDDPIKGPAGLEAVPRRHAALDWEGFMLPGIDPLDGAAVACALLPYLPPEMARADLGWQLTAGAGIKEGIRARTWHFLDRALSAEELKVWLAPLFRGEEPMIDPSTLLDAQPIYLGVTGGPQVQRFGILRGQTRTVAVPAIDLPEARRRARRARKEVKAAAERTQAARAGRLRNRNAAPRMRRLVHQCLVAIRAARGQEGQRLAVFKHQAARARRLAEMGGMSLAHVDEMLLRAGTYLYEGDQERIERNIVPLLAWLRGGS